jgi:hypothetical protein
MSITETLITKLIDQAWVVQTLEQWIGQEKDG